MFFGVKINYYLIIRYSTLIIYPFDNNSANKLMFFPSEFFFVFFNHIEKYFYLKRF